MRLKAYISGALLSAKDLESARLRYEHLGKMLNQIGIDAYLPHRQTDPQIMITLASEDVFEKDIKALSSCDFMVAFLNEPSLGVGAEIALAMNQSKTVIAVYPEGHSISRFILGLLKSSKKNIILQYSNLDEITRVVNQRIKSANINSEKFTMTQ